ncbi:Met-10+ like-protein-domain-containing protein [Stachybotrys elegans]|uniref:tRNA (guanine(37)-N1)-methyltransferase n=1 Tax=Stachybotrys elegans TaxID=80388 RepID=A0A8K0T067_9HYPO|nr:Met-10+ like-protein-domain-containing protein [Stachybotrys elegans]
MNFFRAPAAARAAKTLDRTLFARVLPASAACLRETKTISKYRKELEKTGELLALDKFSPIVPDPDASLAAKGARCLVLKPEVKPSAPETWSSVLRQAAESGDVKLIPYDVNITYDLWSYLDVMKAILPEDLHGEIPVGFNTAGHVAHLNLREPYLPYKHIIAEAIIDKNPNIRTVINKVDEVGTESEFRTFSYEVIGGPDDLLVEVSKSGCVFRFDYSKVYWNSKLDTEHRRLFEMFQPGEVVADVMAGVGPFALPAGKRGVFVWANDKNPESYKYLSEGVKRNKVSEFVKSFNCDGHDFIQKAADMVLEASRDNYCAVVEPARVSRSAPKRPPPVRVPLPPTISHFVMNLPASAIEFLHNFRGLYHGHETLFAPHTDVRLPMVHVHCFAAKGDKSGEDTAPLDGIRERIYKEIGVRLTPGDAEKDNEVLIYEVRDVAPNKRMFCATFRVPPEVAFAPRA